MEAKVIITSNWGQLTPAQQTNLKQIFARQLAKSIKLQAKRGA